MRGRIDSGSLEHFSLSFGWGRGWHPGDLLPGCVDEEGVGERAQPSRKRAVGGAAGACCTNSGTKQENLENLVQRFPSHIS